MTMQSTNTYPGEVFPGISIGDIIVSLVSMKEHRNLGDIVEVLPKSTRNQLYYRTRRRIGDEINSNTPSSFRKATLQETTWYKSAYKKGMFLNIEDMPKDQVINNYQIY